MVAALRTTLKPGGNLIVLVPRGHSLFGSLDRSLGHKRRYSKGELKQLLESQGFTTEQAYDFNRAGAPPWWAYSKMTRARNINKPVLKIFDKTVWLWRRLDWLMPWPGLSLITVARKTGGEGAGREERGHVAIPTCQLKMPHTRHCSRASPTAASWWWATSCWMSSSGGKSRAFPRKRRCRLSMSRASPTTPGARPMWRAISRNSRNTCRSWGWQVGRGGRTAARTAGRGGNRYQRCSARRRSTPHQDADHRAQSAGGAGGPRA